MTSQETRDFIDCVTWEDCTVRLYGRVYWCLGMTYDPDKNEHCIQVYEENAETREFIRELLFVKSDSQDNCMKHFLEDRYWDGKSFYEVAPDMEWVDL